MAAEPLKYDQTRAAMTESVNAMALAWSTIAQSAGSIAHSRRTLFLAYVAEGFTEAQALELVKAP
ncbi:MULTISPECIES: hypothetical protein [unclassified Sphingobium]|uniref:hypothetical protein n=1 Tax=unclassified Sphingobium TaxID=2611147 RepID=UPI002224959D|nr:MULTISPECIES: hypothetical protein [unclassified Sphingobium]MCW2395877.1 hypothetical protein [Sphingobium sp. B8D3B]MCW2419393.1 hypothetical protein [Sphingobium sp. B8D3C]